MRRIILNYIAVNAPLLLMLACFIACFGLSGGIVGLDERSYHFFRLYSAKHTNISYVMDLVTTYGNILLYLIYFAIFSQAIKTNNWSSMTFILSYLIATLLASLLLTYLIKVVVARPRPYLEVAYKGPFSLEYDNHSFPSGHVSRALANATMLANFFRIYYLSFALGFLVALIAFSRIYLAKHYISDTLGAMIPALAALILLSLLSRSHRVRHLALKILGFIKKTLASSKEA